MNTEEDSQDNLLIAAYDAYGEEHLGALLPVGDVANQGASCSELNAVSAAPEQVASPLTPLIFVSPRIAQF